MRRDFTYIDDIVEGVVRVTDQPAKPNILFVFADDMTWFADHPCGTLFGPMGRAYASGLDAVTALNSSQRLAQFADPAGMPGAYPYAAATGCGGYGDNRVAIQCRVSLQLRFFL